MAKLPPGHYESWTKYCSHVLPGLFLAILLAVLAWRLEKITPVHWPANYVIYTIFLGVMLRNAVRLPGTFTEGLKFSARILLFMGVIFLGGTMNFATIVTASPHAVAISALTITSMISAAYYLGKLKLFNLPHDAKALLGVGIGVCGVSAIMALAPVIKAREKHILTAVGASLLNSIIILVLLPVFVHWLGISTTAAGYWSGAVSANTAQSIATGFIMGETAGTIATITKTVRNALMAVVILVFAYSFSKKGLPVGAKVSPVLLWEKFPKFIFGFIILSILTSLNVFSQEMISGFSNLSRWFFAICFVGIGYEINFRELQLNDLKPIALGMLLTFILAGLVLLYLYLFRLC